MKKFIGDKQFYSRVLAISVPIMIQNGITNFVNMLDNVMVGQIGTAQMSGVSIVNQILFVFTLFIFGGCAGTGIFTAQYYGKGDNEGVRNTIRYKIITSALILLIGFYVLIFWQDKLISMFLHSESSPQSIALALKSAKNYLNVMLIGLIPTAVIQVYSSTLREAGETVISMKAGATAVAINLILNYILIFDHFGFKGLGVIGAAIATVISRFVEVLIIVIWAHKHTKEHPYFKKLYQSFKLSFNFVKFVTIKAFPLLINEGLWALGMSTLLQCYSVRGLEVVAAANITNVIANLFNIVFIALGESIAIIVGQLLGSGKMKEAKDTDNKLIFFSTVLCVGLGIILFVLAPYFPELYNTEDNVKQIATTMIQITGLFLPFHALLHAAYFTIRSGGKTVITFLFDSFYMWAVSVVFAFILTRYTNMPIIPIYIIVQLCDVVKTIVGLILVKKNIWLNNLVNK